MAGMLAVALASAGLAGAAVPEPGARPEAAMRLPPPLAVLRSELQRLALCPDEVTRAGADWWAFWWMLPEQGCGDCEDFAAYSYARLEQLGVPGRDLQLLAAEVGETVLGNGERVQLLHVWLEATIDGRVWTLWNRQIRAGSWRHGRKVLRPEEIAALVDDRFGPNWPYGIEVE
jgi:hypothetical protein